MGYKHLAIHLVSTHIYKSPQASWGTIENTHENWTKSIHKPKKKQEQSQFSVERNESHLLHKHSLKRHDAILHFLHLCTCWLSFISSRQQASLKAFGSWPMLTLQCDATAAPAALVDPFHLWSDRHVEVSWYFFQTVCVVNLSVLFVAAQDWLLCSYMSHRGLLCLQTLIFLSTAFISVAWIVLCALGNFLWVVQKRSVSWQRSEMPARF